MIPCWKKWNVIVIYTEEVRDRLVDPLATNFKCRRKSVLENRCQFLICFQRGNGEYKYNWYEKFTDFKG